MWYVQVSETQGGIRTVSVSQYNARLNDSRPVSLMVYERRNDAVLAALDNVRFYAPDHPNVAIYLIAETEPLHIVDRVQQDRELARQLDGERQE